MKNIIVSIEVVEKINFDYFDNSISITYKKIYSRVLSSEEINHFISELYRTFIKYGATVELLSQIELSGVVKVVKDKETFILSWQLLKWYYKHWQCKVNMIYYNSSKI